MAKTKISEYSTTNSDNTDIENINIAEGCAPSGINNAIRELMVHLKEFQTGASGDAFTFAGGTLMSGTNTISGAAIISGNINSSGTNTFSGSNVMSFSGGSSASPSIYFASDTNTGIFSPAADNIAFTEGGVESMRINSNGDLLVGATSVNAGYLVSPKMFCVGGATPLLLSNADNTGTYLQFNTGAANGTVGIVADARSGNYPPLTFTVGGSERARIDSSGNVGIGTTSPVAKLDVQGALAISNNSTSYWKLDRNDSDGSLQFIDTTTERMRIDTSGNVGIGTTSPTERLSVTGNIALSGGISMQNNQGPYWGGGTAYISYNTSSNYMSFGTNSVADRMRITSGGNLLVGTTTSHSLLTVQGQGSFGSTGSGGNGIYLYINNTLSDNSYLSRASAGSGTTTWYIGNQTITTSSDSRLKANIKPTERNAIELLNQWEIVDHTWNDPSDQCENNRNSRGVWTGVVAQQVQPITPWLVNKPTEEVNEDGTINPWTMDFGYAVPLLVKAIQELKAELDATKAEVAALKAGNGN